MSVPETTVSSEPSTAPGRSREATRRRLIAAGTALFAKEGLHAVTSSRIAREAGVATGTFYLHFRDKQALFREIVFAALDQLLARQDRAARGLPSGSLAELRARTEELLVFAEDNRDLIRVVFGRGRESSAIGEEVLDAIAPGFARRLEAGVASGALPAGLHPATAAQAQAAYLTRVLAWWVEDPTRATAEQVVETLLLLNPSQLARGARPHRA